MANSPINSQLGKLEVIIRKEARKTLTMRLGKGYLLVKSPTHCTDAEIHAFIAKNKAWIEQRFEKEKKSAPLTAQEFSDAPLRLFGEPYSFELHPDDQGLDIDYATRLIRAPASWRGTDARMAFQRIAKHAILHRAKAETERLSLSRILPAPPSLWLIKPLGAAWGICDSKRRIALDPALATIPLALADYVIAHEMAHLKHLDHSSAFWAHCETLCPGARRRDRELKGQAKGC